MLRATTFKNNHHHQTHSKKGFLEVLIDALGSMLQRALRSPPLVGADANGAEQATASSRERRIYGAVDVRHPVLTVRCAALVLVLHADGGTRVSRSSQHFLTTTYHGIHPQTPAQQYRRYSPVVADLKFVLNIPGVSAHFATERGPVEGSQQSSCLQRLGRAVLEELQYMHAQERETGAHVAYEPRDWMYAFNVQISLCHVLDCLLGWVRSAGQGGGRAAEEQGAALGAEPPSVLRVGRDVRRGIDWRGGGST